MIVLHGDALKMSYDLGPLGQQSAASAFVLIVGVLTLASVAFTLTRVLLSTFVLPGKSVSSSGKM